MGVSIYSGDDINFACIIYVDDINERRDSARSVIQYRIMPDGCGGGTTFSRHIAPFVDMKGQNYLSLVIMSNFLPARAFENPYGNAHSVEHDA